MRTFRILFFLCVFSCTINAQAQQFKQENEKSPYYTNNKVNTIKVLFTSDLHSCADRYARLTSFINKKRQDALSHGYGVVTVDAGDMAFGTLYSAFFEVDATEYRQLALAGYDAFVFGNHDFDLGLKSLAYMFYNSRILGKSLHPIDGTKLNFPINVTANIDGGDDKTFTQALSYIGHQRYIVLERAGLKVGIFGLLGKDAYEVSNVNGVLSYMEPVKAAQRIIPQLKSMGVDIIICLSHSGAKAKEQSEDVRLAKECPEINLIISGHDHEALFKPYRVGDTYIVSAGENGFLLGEVDLLKSDKGITITDYNLLLIPEDIEPDKATSIIVDSLKTKVAAQFTKRYGVSMFDVIDTIKTPLSATMDSAGFNPFAYDVARAIFNVGYFSRKVVDTARLVSVVPNGVVRMGLPIGPITYSDVFNSLSLGRDSRNNPGYQLVIFYLTGKELKRICEFNVSAALSNPDTYLNFYGLNYTYNSLMPGFFRVKKVYVHGKEVESSQLYPVVTDFYTASSISLAQEKSHGLLTITPKSDTGVEIFDLAKYCTLRGDIPGWNLKYADVSEWYTYALYLRDKVILNDSYPIPAGKDVRSYVPYLILLAIIAAIALLIKRRRNRRRDRSVWYSE